MKKVILSIFTFCLLIGASQLQAQIKTPAPSPSCKTEQVVGLTTVKLDYSRPSVKGRELFVDVEAWGQIWRTGANQATKISFSDDVKLEGHAVPAGTYALYSIPDPNNFTIMLYKDLTVGGNVAKYNEADELVRFKVKTQKTKDHVESFHIHVGNLKSNSADIALMWGSYYIPFKLETEVDAMVEKQIEAAMGGPSRGEYYTAARYYLDNGKDMSKALTWIKAANKIDTKFWQLRVEAQILAKMGKYKDAIATAQKSTAMAEEAKNAGYPKMNAKSITEWKSAMAGSGAKSGGKK